MKKLINQTGLACPFLSRKLTYLTLLLVSLFGSGGSAWAEDLSKTIDLTSYTVSNNKATATNDPVTVELSKTSGTLPGPADSNRGIRWQQNCIITISVPEGSKIKCVALQSNSQGNDVDKVEYTLTDGTNTLIGDWDNNLNTGKQANYIWTVSGENSYDTWVLKNTGSKGDIYFNQITVTYEVGLKPVDAPKTWDFTTMSPMNSITTATLIDNNTLEINPKPTDPSSITTSNGLYNKGGSVSTNAHFKLHAGNYTITANVNYSSERNYKLRVGTTDYDLGTGTGDQQYSKHVTLDAVTDIYLYTASSAYYVKSISVEEYVAPAPTATFTYGQTIFPQETTMDITVPAHKAGSNLTVTLSEITADATASATGLSGNTLTITAPATGSSTPVEVTVTDNNDASNKTVYTINVKTETKVGQTFDAAKRYSQILIDAQSSKFQSGTADRTKNGLSYGSNLDYVPGLVAKAMIEAVDYYKDHKTATIDDAKLKTWFEAVNNFGAKGISQNGKDGKSFDDLNAVKINFGLKSVFASNNVTGLTDNTTRWNEQISQALTGIRTANSTYVIGNTFPTGMQGGWWHKSTYENQMWGDGQYMGTALLAQIINDNQYSGTATDDWNLIAKQLEIYRTYAWDNTANLPHHAFAADKGTNSTSHSDTWKMDGDTYHNEGIWARATGWYFMALIDVLEQMPKDNPNYNTIKGYLTEVAAGVKARQDDATGLWYQLPMFDETFSNADYNSSNALSGRQYNYLESSASALFTAAYFKAIRLGLLDKGTYEATAKKAYQGFVENFIDANNNISWSCRSAGLGGSGNEYKAGGAKFRDGSNAYYLKGYDVARVAPSENLTEGKALGAFIMAATEYERAYLDKSWTITYGSTDETRGTVTAVYTDGGAEFVSGTAVPDRTKTTFTAMPKPGYKVDMSNPWNNATSDHSNPLTYTHTADRNFFAKFIPLEAPTISAQTIADATYKKNSAATPLSVTGATSENGNLSYQWYSNTSNTTVGGTLLNGETGTTFTPQTNKNVGATYYYCEVTETVDRTAQAGDKANGTAICYSDIAKITIAADDCTMEHPGTTYGAIDQTTPYRQARTDVFELKEGEKKVFRFTNHGNSQENYTNWNVAIVSSTDLNTANDDMIFRADNFGWGAIFDNAKDTHDIKMSGGAINWDTFRSDMNDADVEVEIDYTNGSTITLKATSKNGKYVETATTNATSGTKGVYFFVDQSHFCDFRELVSIKATASDGCTLNSVVANDVNIGNENNVTYFVEPNSKVVITTTPTSDKYLRTWNVVGTQGEASKVGDQDIYTINTLATNTTVIAKYGLKSSETLPHPANCNYEETGSEPNITYTITLPAFGYDKRGTQQTIALNLPEFATAVIKDGSVGTIEGDNLTVTVLGPDDSASTIITVTAQNGSQKDYTIKYPTASAPSYDFVVNAVTDRGEVLKEITRGNASNVTVTYPQYILNGTTLYNVPQGDNTPGWYRKDLVINEAGNKNITYDQISYGRVIYYTEGEDIPGMTRAASSNVLVRASNGAVGYNHEEILVTTIPAGAYTIHARGLNGNSEVKTATFKAGDQSVYELTINTGNNNATGTSQPFYVDKETEIYVSCTGGNSSGLDWFYIEKADVLPVTVNEQKFAATQAMITSVNFATSTSSNVSSETTRDGVRGQYYNLKNNKGDVVKFVTVDFTGALGFKVNAYHGNGSDTRHLYMRIDDNVNDIKDMSVTPGSCITSPIYAVTSGKHQLKIYGTDADVYLANIIFLTEKPKGELTSSETELKVTDKSHAPIELATNSGGNISMTTDPSTVAEFATVSFDQQTKGLSITPIKVGTFTLDFSIEENGAYAAGTSTYTVNIRKEQLTMTITPDEGYSWNKTTSPDSQPQLTQPTIVLKDEAGQVVNGKVLTYTSDDPTVATIDGTVIKLAAEPQGSANIYIAFAGDDDYEEVSGIYPILIEQGVSHKFDENTFGGNGPAVGLEKTLYDVKKENGAWVDDTTKPLVYYTFGGWKWGNHNYEVTDAAGKTSEKPDSWTKPALFSGSGGTKPTYVDGYKYAASGAQDAMDESKLLSESPVFGKKRNGWFQSENDDPHIRPFTLPVRGSYIKYDPQVNGYLTVYLLQNGAFNTETGDDGKSYLKVGEFQPHAFHVVDQNGTPVPTYTDFTFVVKEKVTQKHKDGNSIRCSYEGDKVTKDLDNGFVPNGVTFDEHDVATWPMFYTNYTKKERQDIKDAWSSGINGAQKVVKLHNGSFFLTQKAYVKYTFYVAAGQTYYIFSNFSKIGMSGINFVKDAEQPDQENDVLALNDNASFPELKNANTNVSSNLSIPQYGKITVNRSFKKDTWNTICLPFDMTEREVIENFGNDVQILCFDGTEVGDNSNTLHFVYHEIQSILAGYPYLIRPSKEVSGITVKNKLIQPKGFVEFSTSRYWNGTPYVAETTGAYTFKGTIGAETPYKKGDIYMSGTGDLKRMTGESSNLKGYRAYLQSNTADAKPISVVFSGIPNDDNGETTGIIEITEDENGNSVFSVTPIQGVYSINGQKMGNDVRNLPKGMYIINGKKYNVQ